MLMIVGLLASDGASVWSGVSIRKMCNVRVWGGGGGRVGSRLSQVGVNVPIPAPRPQNFCRICPRPFWAQFAHVSGSAADVLLHREQEVDPGRPELLREGLT